MSAVIETFIICDGNCGANYGVDNRGKHAYQHRQGFRKDGWMRVDGNDYCPDCLSKMPPIRDKRFRENKLKN